MVFWVAESAAVGFLIVVYTGRVIILLMRLLMLADSVGLGKVLSSRVNASAFSAVCGGQLACPDSALAGAASGAVIYRRRVAGVGTA